MHKINVLSFGSKNFNISLEELKDHLNFKLTTIDTDIEPKFFDNFDVLFCHQDFFKNNSVEDIFKEIAGKFGSDRIELEKEFTKLKDGSILTDGNSRIRDLNNYLSWSIPEESSKTINGLITEYLDQIPQSSLCIEIQNYRFEVLEIDENSISKIKIKKT